MLFSQFLPIALLAAVPAAMASSQCSANVMLNQPNNDHKSTLTITSKDGTQFLAHSQGIGPFCGDKTFSTDDLEKNKNTGNGQLTASFVWKGECDKGEKNGFTYVNLSRSLLRVDTDDCF